MKCRKFSPRFPAHWIVALCLAVAMAFKTPSLGSPPSKAATDLAPNRPAAPEYRFLQKELPFLAPWQEIVRQAEVGVASLETAPTVTGNQVRWHFEPPLEFTNAFQSAVISPQTMAEFAPLLDDAPAMSIGGWFYARRKGEQTFFARGVLVVAPDGERVFCADDRFITFCLGTDQRGFLLGTIHGNGSMPFPYVTLSDVTINRWHQLVVVKNARGHHAFYQNGALVHTDEHRLASGYIRPFRETEAGRNEPMRLAMPLGGKVGEVWVAAREMTAEEIHADYQNHRRRYRPAPPGTAIALRQMHAHPDPSRWQEPVTAENWTIQRQRSEAQLLERLGPFPQQVSLDPRTYAESDAGTYVQRKVSFAVQPGDRMPAYLLIPKQLPGPVPAVICMYGTTSGAGKDTTVGLSGREPGSPPHPNYSFAVDVVKAGMVALAPDWLRDGERVLPGERPYESASFRRDFPHWSIAGKDAWDTSRAVDYLQSLEFVDPDAIGMMGHSYGGGGTIHAAALDTRIRVAVANGPVSCPLSYHELTALIAPRPLLVGQAVGERRPQEEEIHAAVSEVYRALGQGDRVHYFWYAGDHDFPPEARRAAIDWFVRWFSHPP